MVLRIDLSPDAPGAREMSKHATRVIHGMILVLRYPPVTCCESRESCIMLFLFILPRHPLEKIQQKGDWIWVKLRACIGTYDSQWKSNMSYDITHAMTVMTSQIIWHLIYGAGVLYKNVGSPWPGPLNFLTERAAGPMYFSMYVQCINGRGSLNFFAMSQWFSGWWSGPFFNFPIYWV